MGGTGKILGVIFVVISLGLGIAGAVMMFYIVPNAVEEKTFPGDFDEHNVYGGYMDRLNTGNGQWETTGFTIDRRIRTTEKMDDGKLLLEENIKGIVNGTDMEVPDLCKHNSYVIDEQNLKLHSYHDLMTGIYVNYTDEDRVQWIFPHPVDKDKGYNVFNMNILDHSGAEYLGTEEIQGVECYVFKGAEVDYEVPLPASTREQLGDLANGSAMKMTLWEKAWVHPLTGSIIDYEKEIDTYLYLPELPPVPEVKYPSDLESASGFDGDLMIFDQETASFMTYEGIRAKRYIDVIAADGYDLTANETVTVTTAGGQPLSMLSSEIQVIFDARTGTHTGPDRSGHYLFSPTGAQERNYSIWDDAFGLELNAEYEGEDLENFAPLTANIYHIYLENGTYLPGGTATLDMTYWVEPTSGIVLDVEKHLWNWRPQDARRLPQDTEMINKTMVLNVTLTVIDPFTGGETPIEIYVEQMVNCTGYTDMTCQVAKMTETVTRYLPDGAVFSPPEVAKFGVDAHTMEYIDVEGWSTINREGFFTFPIGLLNETGEVTPSFTMYNSDLGASFEVELAEVTVMQGLDVARYEMNLTSIPLTYDQLTEVLGQDPGLPGATGSYDCLFVYDVHIDTGSILDIHRSTTVSIIPPSYEFLYDNLDSGLVFTGVFGDENITATTAITGEDAGEGFTKLYIDRSYVNGTGADFLPPSSSNVTVNTLTHEVVNETFQGQGYYVLFPPDPMQRNNYTQIQDLGGEPIIGVAIMGEETETTVAYNWTGMTIVDGGLFNEMLAGTNWTLTMEYNYLLDRFTGAVMDASVELLLENSTLPASPIFAVFTATEQVKAGLQMNNAVLGWALSGMAKPLMNVQVGLFDTDAQYAFLKAQATSQLLLIADGVKPALELKLSFNETTRAEMLQTAMATSALLEKIPLLQGAHMMNDVLEANDNKVLHVYYKKVEKNANVFEGVDGSVEYWAEIAKESDADYERLGILLPTILYVLGGIGLVTGAVLIIARDRRTEEAEE